MKAHTLKQALNTFNLLIITTFLVLALYSALGQQIFPFVGQYRVDIENYISEQLGSDVSIRSLSGDMNILTPSIHLEGITMKAPDEESLPSLSIAAIDAVLDPQASLINLTPVFKSVRISGLSVYISQDRSAEPKSEKDNSAVIQSFIEGLLLQQHVELNNVTIEFYQNKAVQRIELDNLAMTGDGFNRLMTGSILFGSENPIKASLRLYSEGSPYKLDTFYARGVLDLPKLEVDYWLEKILDVSVFDSFDASSQVSMEFKSGRLNYAKLNLASTEVAIPSRESFKNVSAELWLKQSNTDTWSLWLKDSGFNLKGKKWNLEDVALKLSKTESGNRWQGFIKKVNIPYVYDLISSLNLMPDAIESIYQDLSPTGALEDFNVIVQQSNSSQTPENKFTVAGKLNGVSTKAHNAIPALSNISGVIAANKHSGRVQFEGRDFQVDFPSLYENPFKINKGKGQVDWSLGDQGVSIVGNGIDFSMDGIESLKGGFDLRLPKKSSGHTGGIELNLSTKNANITAHPILVPKVTPESLKHWLDSALLGGSINSGSFYFYDSIGEGQSNPNMELYLSANDATLKYLEDWPELNKINGKIFVDNLDVLGKFETAKTLGGYLTGSQLVYQSGDVPYLWVGSDASGSSSEMFSYFQVTPLKSVVNNIFERWNMSGKHKSWLGLKIPMNGNLETLKADMKVGFERSQLAINDINLNVENINGPLRYSTKTGLTSAKIHADIWGDKYNAQISSETFGRDLSTDIQFSGRMKTHSLKDWLKLFILDPISGASEVAGHVLIDTRENAFTGLTFTSDLKGIKVDLPGKFNKKPESIEPLKGSLQLKDGQILRVNYGDKVNLAMKLNQGQLVAGQVYVGQTEAYIPTEPGVIIDGHVASMNLNEWLDAWDKIIGSEYSGANSVKQKKETANQVLDQSLEQSIEQPNVKANPVRLMNVSTDVFKYNDFEFEQVKSVIRQKNNVWEFEIDAPVATGVITLADKKPIKVDLEYFHWPMIVSEEGAEKIDPFINVDPKVFPWMEVDVDEVFLGPTNYGDWQAVVNPVKHGVHFSNIDGFIKKLKVKGDLTWIKPDDKTLAQTTKANLVLTSNDVAGIQKAWRMKPALEAKYGKMNGQLSWLGSPVDPAISSISGILDVHFKDGRFIDAADAGSLSAFGLLNFSAIGRRLRLDFSDVYQSGFHFDLVKGKTTLDKGVMKVVDTLEIEGPSAKFAASGTVNLNTKELNQELSATFPVTGTLPLIAIIAGFAPPVAASLFVGERLVGEKIEKFTSATYKLTGTWNEPKLDLMKRFDNNIEGKQEKSFWYRMKDFFGVGDD